MTTTPNTDPLVGTKIREYQILDVIGKGGMGAVYSARHIYLDEERAVKVIHTGLKADRDFVDRFIREARILSKLRHPNLVQLFEFGPLEEGAFFMVMELIRGESVLERLRRKTRFPVEEAIEIVRQAALGLHSAHQKGIIHRDISPDNLMLVKDDTEREITKVLDFGIAKPLSEGTHNFTVANMFIGKPEYSSPEQCGLLEDGEIIDRRSDIYSLAVTLYYMLAGRLPFTSQTPQGYLFKHAMEPPPPLSTFVPADSIPAALERTLMKALAKKRHERHATLEEFVQELDKAFSIAPATHALEMNAPATEEVHIPIRGIQPGNIFAKRYLIEKKLGEGGMGAVFKAIDKILEVPVALKIMSVRIVNDDITLERFKREVILARKVAHPNACRIYDIGESDGVHYVSMEYLEGKTLSEMIGEAKIPVQEGLHIIRQVLEALHEAHRVGIVHRDLKPQNIMVGAHQHAFILDFGISISADARRVTQTGLIVGTPYYMAPEQFEGKNVDLRVDIYSVGVIMYEMFTSKLPFQGTTPMAIIYAHLKSTPTKLSELVPGIDPAMERVVMKCLEKEAQNRYQTVQEVLEAIEPLTKTPSALLHRQRIAHQLLAEKHYSKAIKYLHTMVESSPDNVKWQKLLRNAVYEKTKRDLLRARSHIRRKNLGQAQLLLERVRRSAPKTQRITGQVEKLQQLLRAEYEHTLQAFLSEADELLQRQDWMGASQRLQSASNLVPNDPRVAALQERIQQVHQKKLQEKCDAIAASYRKTAADQTQNAAFYEEQSQNFISKLNELLKEYPSFAPASALKDEIADFQKLKAIQFRVRQELEVALQSLSAENFALCDSLLQKLLPQISEQSLRSEISVIRKGLHEIDKNFTTGNYEKVPEMILNLQKADSGGWLKPHLALFNQLNTVAQQKALARRKFQEALEAGQLLYESKQWQKAIHSFTDALKIFPEDSNLLKLLFDAENQLKAENHLRADLVARLKHSEKLFAEKQLFEAQSAIEQAKQILNPQFQLKDLQERLEALRIKVQGEIDKESTRKQLISKNLEEATFQYQRSDLEGALQIVQDVLKENPEVSAAVKLKADIQKSIKEKEEQSQNFMRLFEEGKRFYDDAKWAMAIVSWRRALEIIPDNQSINDWIAEAQTQLSAERRIRADLNLLMEGFRNCMTRNDLEKAKTTLKDIQELVRTHTYLKDMNDQLPALSQQLEAEVEKTARIKKEIAVRLTNIKQQIANAVRLLTREELKECSKALNLLRGLPHDFDQREIDSVINGLSAVLESVKTNKLTDSAQFLQQLETESPLFIPHIEELRQFAANLLERQRRIAESTRILEEGMSYFSAGQWEQAIEFFQRAEKIDPSSIQIHQYIVAARQRLKASQFSKPVIEPTQRIQEQPVIRQEPPYVPPEPAIRQQDYFAPPPIPQVAAKRPYWIAIPVAVVLLAFIGLAIWLLSRKDAPPTPPLTLNMVRINALPWARVKITPRSKELKIDPISPDQATTPCTFSLPAGEYTLELENGGLTQPLIQNIQVRDGAAQSLEFTMPAYDPKRVLSEVMRTKKGGKK